MKLIICLMLLLCLMFFSPAICISQESNEPILITTDSTKGAKINVYCYDSSSDDVKEKPVLLVHGFTSNGSIWSSENEKKIMLKILEKMATM